MTKYSGRGITVELDGTPLGNLTAFGEVGSTRSLIDASAFGDDWKDYVMGQQDGSEVTFTVALDPVDAGAVALVAAYDSGDQVVFTVAHAESGLNLDATAIVTALSRGGTLDGMLQMSCTAKIVEPGVVEGS